MFDAGDPDVEDLRTLIAALAELEDDSHAVEPEDRQARETQRVSMTMELKTLVDQRLHDAVERARAHQVSWQQIGDVLDISRQAAFQRFRNPDDAKGHNHMQTKSNNALIPKAEAVYHLLEADNYADVAGQMTFLVQRALPEKKVMGVWSEVHTVNGVLESLGESFVRPARRNSVVVETPLLFEAGEAVGRIAFNKRNKIVGMLIMRPEDIASAPF